MKYAITFLLLFYACIIHAQNNDEYSNADRIALSIPSSETLTTAAIAAYICSHVTTDAEKVRAAYVWVAANIRYSTDSLHYVILIEDHDQLIINSLRRKKGVCENFAAILNDICKKCGLHSFVVEGYTKQNNAMDNTAHAWCIVYVNNAWHLYDPTWDEGVAKSYAVPVNTVYFDVPPGVFIVSHMPFDPMFQLLEHPVSYKDFYRGNIWSNSNNSYFNYNDSIAAYEKQNPLDEYTASVNRIQGNGDPNRMASLKIAELKMEVEIINQDKDSALYSNAVAGYNKAINILNDLIAYRNSQFKPVKSASEVDYLFAEVDKNLSAAHINIDALKRSKSVLTLDTGDLEYALKNLSNKLQDQKVFFKNYVAATQSK